MVEEELEKMMSNLMERLYDNLGEAKAFAISFTNFVYMYDDIKELDFTAPPCNHCKKTTQVKDYLVPKSGCRKPYAILDTYEFGVSIDLRNELIQRFDIFENDFRPIRNRTNEIIYYQITPQHVMLPIYQDNKWIAQPPCPECGAVQYIDCEFENEKGEPYYYMSQAALDDMHDLNVTSEKFDFHLPLFIISRRVYDFLIEKYPRTHYFPLFLK